MTQEEAKRVEIGDRLISIFDNGLFNQNEEVICVKLPSESSWDDYAYYAKKDGTVKGGNLQDFNHKQDGK